MGDRWLGISEAAEHLEVTKRTIWRWVRSGRLDSREGPGGRQVRVETPVTDADITKDTVSLLEDQGERQLQVAGTAVTLATKAADQARKDLKRARRVGLAGWTLTFGLLVVGVIGAWWGATEAGLLRLSETRADMLDVELAETDAELVKTEVAQVQTAAELVEVRGDLVVTRSRLDDSQAHVVRLVGELADARVELAVQADELGAAVTSEPTTRPAVIAAAREPTTQPVGG